MTKVPNEMFRLKYTMTADEKNEAAELKIYGEIISEPEFRWFESDVDQQTFDKELKVAKASGAKTLNIRINSGGGEVYAAVAMRAMVIAAGFEHVNVSIEGLCASAATLFATIPGAHVTIAEGSEFMIHNPMTWAFGNSSQIQETVDHLHKMENQFHEMYAKKCGKDEKQVKDWMDASSWFSAREAVEFGFCDELSDAQPIAASVSSRCMNAMRAMYHYVPDEIAVNDDSNTEPTVAAGDVTVNKSVEMEEQDMDVKELTMEQLQSGNAELYNSIMEQGAQSERERMQDIDALTMAGYEDMAEEAKANGTSAAQFMKMIVKAQKEKGQQYLAQRTAETAPAAEVEGAAAEDSVKNDAEETEKAAKSIADYAKNVHAETSGMY